eukprot:Blabericola_migrator_1__6830@NODE_345_length_9575_cov_29_104544_g278_i0_p5_GENE_NODE_345_length_9575_cov_29_104544_g278_i0NODE_345_length_9575_cov_29_104544_g278_i0_p5_ORF_typecomplete_len367_score83_84Alpha_GJ/PF03229_13/5_7Alpha_GJ/PF03229_13/5_3LapA_dom/PF06305_11/5_2e03LapA_dom/PF06305_11/0_047LAP1C/PF05609_12/0_048TMEM154/PF15102_6/0_21Vpu/PF00558_19/0_27Enkurin/PF13864_6/36Enkurin/PF13864_6/24_NODE_345_length_9575_cov_29_104544_g278_i084249524
MSHVSWLIFTLIPAVGIECDLLKTQKFSVTVVASETLDKNATCTFQRVITHVLGHTPTPRLRRFNTQCVWDEEWPVCSGQETWRHDTPWCPDTVEAGGGPEEGLALIPSQEAALEHALNPTLAHEVLIMLVTGNPRHTRTGVCERDNKTYTRLPDTILKSLLRSSAISHFFFADCVTSHYTQWNDTLTNIGLSPLRIFSNEAQLRVGLHSLIRQPCGPATHGPDFVAHYTRSTTHPTTQSTHPTTHTATQAGLIELLPPPKEIKVNRDFMRAQFLLKETEGETVRLVKSKQEIERELDTQETHTLRNVLIVLCVVLGSILIAVPTAVFLEWRHRQHKQQQDQYLERLEHEMQSLDRRFVPPPHIHV